MKRRSRRFINVLLSSILLLFLLFLPTTCGKATNTSSDTGSLTFTVIWKGGNHTAAQMRAQLDCTTAGVSTVEAIVYDQGNNQLAQGGPWSCTDHQGTVSGVPVGDNRKVVILAKDANGDMVYEGEKPGVSVTSGQTTNVGEITAYSCVPTITGISSGDMQLTITWQDVSYATSYNLYWSTTAGVSKTTHSGVFSGLTTNTYIHTPLTNGTTYYYVLTSINAYGESAESAEVNAKPNTSGSPPAAPTGVSATAGNAQVTVSWNAVSGATSYNVYWSTSTGVSKTAYSGVLPSITTTCTHTSLTNGTTYYYVVTAVNTYGESAASAEEHAIPLYLWAKTYGGATSDNASIIQQTTDGGYIVSGSTATSGAGWYDDFWVLKLNSDGTVSWQKTYGGTYSDYAYSIQQTADGGYVVAGNTDSFGAGIDDLWVLKLNSAGTVSWQKTYGGTGNDSAYSIQQTRDGGYIVAGYTSSFGAGANDAWVLKLDSNGFVAWQKTYGGTSDDYALSIQQTVDGGYIVAGYTTSFGAGSPDAWVLKLDSNGFVAWQKTYGGTGYDIAGSIKQTNDGGYIVAGYTASFGAGSHDFWVLKLNSDGTVAWQKTYGGTGTEYAGSIQQTADGGYIVEGRTNSFGAGDFDFWVLKLNSDGAVAWQKTYGGTGYDYASSIQQTADGGYIVLGSTSSAGAGGYDLWVLKLNSDGTIGCGIGADSSATIFTPSGDGIISNATTTNSSSTSPYTSVTGQDTTATVNTQCQ